MRKLLFLFLSIFALCLTACGNSPSINYTSNTNNVNTSNSSNSIKTSINTGESTANEHEHTYSISWSYDETYHWHDATCGHDVVSNKAKHQFIVQRVPATFEHDGTLIYRCSECVYCYTAKGDDQLKHNYSNDWSYNETSHWHACTDDGYESLKADEENHLFEDIVTEPTYTSGGYTTHTCTVCGYSYTDSATDKKLVTITLSSSNESKGTVSGGGEYEYGSEAILTATPADSYSFTGWYLNEELLSCENPYRLKINTTNNLSIIGKFVGEIYTIHFETNGGDLIDDLIAEEGDPICVNPTKNGYSFVGWYTDPSCSLASYFELGDTMPAYNGTLYAKWSLVNYTITYHLDSRTTNNTSNPTTYNVLTETITLLDPTVSHGTFVGWYTDAGFTNQITQIVNGTTGNLDLYAKEIATIYTITFETNGGNSISPISATYGDSVVIPTPVKGNMVFVGWFTDQALTQRAYITTMPGENITLYAMWSEMYTIFEIKSRQYIFFGSYPQSKVYDSSLKTELTKISSTNSRGYYEYGGSEYAKKRTEFYKVEPILWTIFTGDSSSNYTLVTDKSIYALDYTDSQNSYSTSNARTWLNSSFFNDAFNSAEKSAILTTIVDNSAATTASDSNPYVCENTEDKAFLLSFKEIKSGKIDSRCKPTDFALANNCHMYTGDESQYYGNCNYWTRSHYYWTPHTMEYVTFMGYITHYDYFGASVHYGVRPALNVSL